VLVAIVSSGLDIAARAPGHHGCLRLRLVRFGADSRGLPHGEVPTPDGDIDREILHPANPGSVYHLTQDLGPVPVLLLRRQRPGAHYRSAPGIVWGTQNLPRRRWMSA